MQRHGRGTVLLLRQLRNHPSCRYLTTVETSNATSTATDGNSVGDQKERSQRKAEAKKLRREKKWTETDFLKRRKEYDAQIKAVRFEFQKLEVDKKSGLKSREVEKEEQLKQTRAARSQQRR